jgi:hypothetical protein
VAAGAKIDCVVLVRRAFHFVCVTAMAIATADVPAHTAPRPSPAAGQSDAERRGGLPLAGQRDPSLETLAADAAGLPPELAADALIRIASSARVTDRSWRRELLTEAFFHAYGARDQYRRGTRQSIPPDTRQGAQLLASAMSLNRVSLQVRASQLMAFVDTRRARELFEWIDLDLTAGVCEDPLVPAVDEYYTALSLLARTTFGQDRAEALRFLELYLWRARLPSEMPAVARAVLRFDPRPDEAAYLERLFSIILEAGSADARSFSASALDIISRSAELQAAEARLGLRGIPLMESVRAYVINQMKGPRCADSVWESMAPAAFNAALVRGGLADDVKPIEGDTVRPSRMLGTARLDQFWQTSEARRLHDRAVQLRGTEKDPVPLKVRETTEWQNEAEKVLVDVEQWTGTSERLERDYLAQKSMLLLALLDLVPPSTLRTRVIHAFVDFLRHEDDDRDRRALWFAFVNRLLELSRGEDRGEILAAFDAAHHPVFSVYAELERLVPIGRQSQFRNRN